MKMWYLFPQVYENLVDAFGAIKGSDGSVWYVEAPMVSFFFYSNRSDKYLDITVWVIRNLILNACQRNEYTEIKGSIRRSWTRKSKEIINAFGKNRTQDCYKMLADLRILQ